MSNFIISVQFNGPDLKKETKTMGEAIKFLVDSIKHRPMTYKGHWIIKKDRSNF